MRDPLRCGGGCAHRQPVDLRAQELLLPRPAQGLPDQPIRNPGGAGRPGAVRDGRAAARRYADTCTPGRRRRQVAARRRWRPRRHRRVGHRPQPCRHAAAGDRHRARHALGRRGGGVRAGLAHAGGVAGHLRRQHAGRQLSLRCQRVGAQAGWPAGHAARDQEPQLVPVHEGGDRVRDQLADRPPRRRPGHRAGHSAVRRRQRPDARDAQQRGRARLPLLPRPRPAAAGDRAAVDRASQGRDARAARCDGRALRARRRPARIRRRDDDAEPGVCALLRGGARRLQAAQVGGQLDDG